ncbi:ATP-binding protein [Desemzia sp. FAM 24101]|uniref:ATP-binding protein n=1 Tax=Desemzia sp. FAM 24101 TaxID=3259522 RepID=UPI00388B2DDB
MKLKKITLENFRSYQQPTTMNFNDFTTIVGRNDSGKSTFLEALDIFFNNSKMDISDVCVSAPESDVIITCHFTNLPSETTLDSASITNFEDEYLVNENGYLEIAKIFSGKQMKSKTYIRSSYFLEEEPLFTLTRSNLRTLVDKYGIENVNKNENPSMRSGLNLYFKDNNFELKTELIQIDKGNEAKSILTQIESNYPLFSLFKSDRSSTDEDSEVQDPMKSAVKEAIINVQEELNDIADKVVDRAIDTANRTIDNLSMYDEKIASEFKVELTKELKWDSLFKLSLRDQNDISVNKRGSGVRRLMLLSFFTAISEKNNESNRNFIYAVEEPETGQHPDYQKNIIKVLQYLSKNNNTQVVITTHAPSIASLVHVESLVMIKRNDMEKEIVEYQDDTTSKDMLKEICDDIGVISNMFDPNVKLIIHVEGPTDIQFFKEISTILSKPESGYHNFANDNNTLLLEMGGMDSLKRWKTNDTIERVLPDVMKVFIIDNDGYKTPGITVEDNEIYIVLERRTIENYYPCEMILSKFGIEEEHLNKLTSNNANIPKEVSDILMSKGIKQKQNYIKKGIAQIAPDLTLEDLENHGVADELKEIMKAITDKILIK